MNKLDNIIEVEDLLRDLGELGEDREFEWAETKTRCTYCGALWYTNDAFIPKQCNGECGESPTDFSDLRYDQELKFDE